MINKINLPQKHGKDVQLFNGIVGELIIWNPDDENAKVGDFVNVEYIDHLGNKKNACGHIKAFL